VLTRLIEVLLVEALRSAPAELLATGFLTGLRDPQLASALRGIHTETVHPWTLVTLARAAGMSRSSFAERFARVIGMTPLNYFDFSRVDRDGIVEPSCCCGPRLLINFRSLTPSRLFRIRPAR
jgi:transcriptional regulator GlxA family with amidase domain